MANWLTPEEIEAKRKRNKLMLLMGVPVITITLSALLTYLLNTM